MRPARPDHEPPSPTFGRQIAIYMALGGLDEAELAQSAGLAQDRLNALLRAGATPSPAEVLRLSIALDVTPDRLVRGRSIAPQVTEAGLALFRRITASEGRD